MRKLKLYIACSLDGKIARPDGSFDWLPDPGTEDYGYQQFYDSIDAVVMGYKTYEACLGFGEWPYPDKKSYVFSRTPGRSLIPEATLAADPVAFIKELTQQPGQDIWLLGGGDIITQLHEAGLIDEYILAYIPIILGEGLELFPQIKREQNLQVQKHEVYHNGVVLLYLQPVEKPAFVPLAAQAQNAGSATVGCKHHNCTC